jgi:RNA polymerase sigma-70 factor (ECF subfamily)
MSLNAADQVAAHRPMLVRFARQRLHNDAWAEDAVSDTLVAALERPDAYAGRASVRTWLIGILKHKVVDQIRRHTRECQVETLEDVDPEYGDLPGAAPGGAREPPFEWGDPQECLRRRQFMEHLGRCLKALPPQQARAVMLRDCMEEETEFVCNELGVTANNLGVILHRARVQLRASLQMHRTTASGNTSPQPRVGPIPPLRAFAFAGTGRLNATA